MKNKKYRQNDINNNYENSIELKLEEAKQDIRGLLGIDNTSSENILEQLIQSMKNDGMFDIEKYFEKHPELRKTFEKHLEKNQNIEQILVDNDLYQTTVQRVKQNNSPRPKLTPSYSNEINDELSEIRARLENYGIDSYSNKRKPRQYRNPSFFDGN